jgi:hypothetical protein
MNGSAPNPEEIGAHSRASTDDLLHLAELELSAFAAAVNELFGPEEARVSAHEWIEELLAADQPIRPGIPDWR